MRLKEVSPGQTQLSTAMSTARFGGMHCKKLMYKTSSSIQIFDLSFVQREAREKALPPLRAPCSGIYTRILGLLCAVKLRDIRLDEGRPLRISKLDLHWFIEPVQSERAQILFIDLLEPSVAPSRRGRGHAKLSRDGRAQHTGIGISVKDVTFYSLKRSILN